MAVLNRILGGVLLGIVVGLAGVMLGYVVSEIIFLVEECR